MSNLCQEENSATSSSSQELETAILKTRETLRALKKQVSQLHACQLARFSRKLPNFEAQFTRLRISNKTPKFRQHSTFIR